MRIAVLALQGAFAEHQQMLQRLGVESFLVRNLDDWNQQKDGLIIPGGESTAMMRIVRDEGLFCPLREAIINGLPVFGTCAGLIMLDKEHLNTMDITVRRNAYGRQLGSFCCEGDFKGIGKVPMTFIRAPYIEEVGKDTSLRGPQGKLSSAQAVEILSVYDNHIVAARQGNQLVTAFHPELSNSMVIHQYYIEKLCTRNK